MCAGLSSRGGLCEFELVRISVVEGKVRERAAYVHAKFIGHRVVRDRIAKKASRECSIGS